MMDLGDSSDNAVMGNREKQPWRVGLGLRKLPGIRSRYVALQLLNSLRLTGDDPLHQVAN